MGAPPKPQAVSHPGRGAAVRVRERTEPTTTASRRPPPDNCIDSRSRRWHISRQIGGRGHRAPADRPGPPAGLGEPWRSPRAVLAGRGEEPGTPREGCRREKCCRSAPQAKMSYSRLTAPVAQGTEQRTSNPLVGGSNPPRRASNFNGLADLA